MTREEITEIVTTDLRRARELAGLTQHGLAKLTGGGLSRSYIAMIETGARPMPDEHVELVAQAISEAYASRMEFRRRARQLIERVYPFTDADAEALQRERRRREQMLAHRNEYGA